MNNKRRKKLSEAMTSLRLAQMEAENADADFARIKETVGMAAVVMLAMLEQEEEAYDNMPENLQSTDTAYDMEERIRLLDDAADALMDIDSIEDFKEKIDEIVNHIDDAIV